MTKKPKILAIDTSCDETSAAVAVGTTVLANVIASQVELHKKYGGVFPTIAKQAHQQNIKPVIKLALSRAKTQLEQIKAIAVTQGPGLAPALEIGINEAKELAKKNHQPLIAINHLEAHALSVLAQAKKRSSINLHRQKKRLPLVFPILSLVISGGHSQFILVNQIGHYQILGSSLDDAAGECLDKVGRMLNLGYPAGPVIEELAKKGNQQRFHFPLPMTQSNNYDLSFSGLKTYARNLIEKLENDHQINKQLIFDFCASFQNAVFKHISYKLNKILFDRKKTSPQRKITEIWIGGGVAANASLRKEIRTIAKQYAIKVQVPMSKRICSDNAAMVAVLAGFKYLQKDFISNPRLLDRRPNWPLTQP